MCNPSPGSSETKSIIPRDVPKPKTPHKSNKILNIFREFQSPSEMHTDNLFCIAHSNKFTLVWFGHLQTLSRLLTNLHYRSYYWSQRDSQVHELTLINTPCPVTFEFFEVSHSFTRHFLRPHI